MSRIELFCVFPESEKLDKSHLILVYQYVEFQLTIRDKTLLGSDLALQIVLFKLLMGRFVIGKSLCYGNTL